MKKAYLVKILRILAFVVCAAVVFSFVSALCERKTYTGAWNYMAKLNEFYDMEKNTLDYIGVGSSHMYCSLNPLEVWESSGVSGFLLATQQQPLMASYYYIKEAFKTQSPKIVVVEGYMAYAGADYDSSVLYDAIDPLKPSLNKFQMINNLVSYDKRPEYYFNILKYHTRWSEITESEVDMVFSEPVDIYKGFVALDGNFVGRNVIPDYSAVKEQKLLPHNLEALNDIRELIEKNGAKMVLMIAPYEADNESFVPIIKAERIWAEENGVDVLDYALLLDEIGIDPNNDYYDAGHLDASGAAKLSDHFASYLTEIGMKKTERINEKKWQADLDTYKLIFQEE